jgi:hypothetical protein
VNTDSQGVLIMNEEPDLVHADATDASRAVCFVGILVVVLALLCAVRWVAVVP